MQMDEKTLIKIAKLARIRVREDERAHYAAELSTIFGWIEQLQEVNTDGVAIMTSVVNMPAPMRADAVTDGGYTKEVLANAPKADFDSFVVPKVVDQG
jgi:aspartyl-tRNA(Asn)/glutamyl-tRNA(Gln) amidotransferase subunit C